VGSKSGGIVPRRSLDEPCLLCLSEQTIFDLTAGVIAIVDVEGFVDGTVGEDNVLRPTITDSDSPMN
jgi:hypothetical protein